MIPALRNAEFLRYGVMHRNTYLKSPVFLNRYYQVMERPNVMFAGQITGVEGYVESTASGCLVALELARRLEGKAPVDFPRETAMGAMALYISVHHPIADIFGVFQGGNHGKHPFLLREAQPSYPGGVRRLLDRADPGTGGGGPRL